MTDVSLDSLVPTESKYLTKEDVGEEGRNLTIAGFKIAEVGSGDNSEKRCIMGFQEADIKPMVVNKTNMNRLKHITGATTTGEAKGKVINCFNDPLVEFGGKLVGGIRIREAQTLPEATIAGNDFDFDNERVEIAEKT